MYNNRRVGSLQTPRIMQGDFSAAQHSVLYFCRYFGKVYKVDLTRMRKDKLSFEQVFQAEMGTDFVGGLVSQLPEVSFDELVEEIVPTLLIIDEALVCVSQATYCKDKGGSRVDYMLCDR